MRDNSVLRKLLGLCVSTVVVVRRELRDGGDGGRSNLVVWVRRRVGVRGRCGRCGGVAPWFDNGGGERRWRHIDVGMATCELIAEAPRVSCPEHGPTVAEVAFARHDSAFSRAFEDLVVFDAIVSNKLAAARRHGISWRAVDHMCIRVATEALGRIDLLEGLVAIAIDEVKYKKGHKYLTVVCDHLTGRVIWAAKGRNKETVRAFFDALGEERAAQLQFVTCDGAEWIRSVIAERARSVGARLRVLEAGRDWRGTIRGQAGVEVEVELDLAAHPPTGRPVVFRSPLAGLVQVENLAVAAAAAGMLGIPDQAILAGAASVRWPGRLQWVDGAPPLLLDGAHNPAALAALSSEVPGLAGGRRVVALFGAMYDKQLDEMLPRLAQMSDEVVFTSVGGGRAASAALLAGMVGGGTAVEPVAEALSEARRRAGRSGLVVVCGSLAVVGAVLAQLEPG